MNVERTRGADALEEGLRGKDGWKEAARAIALREWEFDAKGKDELVHDDYVLTLAFAPAQRMNDVRHRRRH